MYALKLIAKTDVARHEIKGQNETVINFKDVTLGGKFYAGRVGRDRGFALMLDNPNWQPVKGVVDANNNFIAE